VAATPVGRILTFIATTILLVPEIYELTGRVSVFKLLALIINILVVIYLLFAKRLFGLRGGGAAEEAAIERDSSWQALEAVLPPYRAVHVVPTAGTDTTE
jgi:hypothetical protein